MYIGKILETDNSFLLQAKIFLSDYEGNPEIWVQQNKKKIADLIKKEYIDDYSWLNTILSTIFFQVDEDSIEVKEVTDEYIIVNFLLLVSFSLAFGEIDIYTGGGL